MKIMLAVTVATVLVALYVTLVRPWMRGTAWGARFLDAVEPVERALYSKSESILWARFLAVLGAVLTFLVNLGSVDLTWLQPLLPPRWQWVPSALPLLITVAGIVQERLRRDTTKPLEVVAMRTDAPVEVKVATAEAEVAMKQAAELAAETDAAADRGG